MYSDKGRRWTRGIIIMALLAIGSLLAYDMLWGAALVQSTKVPVVEQPAAPQPQSPSTNGTTGSQQVQGEDGQTYTVDPDGTVRDANGNVVGQAEMPPSETDAGTAPTQ